MARTEPYPTRVENALLQALRDAQADESKWHHAPLTVELLESADDWKKPRPSLFVKLGEVDGVPGTNNEWDDKLDIAIHCLTADGAAARAAVHWLAADVRRILRTEYRGLGGLVDSGYLFVFGYTWAIQNVAGRGGYGEAIVKAEVRYLTADDTA